MSDDEDDKSGKLQRFPPTYTTDIQEIKRTKKAAIDQDLNTSEFQRRAIMRAVEEHEAAQQQKQEG